MALTADEKAFVQGVSAGTGIDPRVLIAWVQSEGHPGDQYHNYLNIQTQTAQSLGVPTVGTAAANTAEFGNVQTGIDATVKEIRSLGLTHLAHQTPQAEITQIAASPWASSHYGGPGGPNLQNTFSGIFHGGLTSPYVGPGQAGPFLDAQYGFAPTSATSQIAGGPIGTATKDVVGALTSPFKFLTSWRFVEVVGGFLLLLVGLVLVARQFGLGPPVPAGLGGFASKTESVPDTFGFQPGEMDYNSRQPASRPARTKMRSVSLEPYGTQKPKARAGAGMSDSIPY